MTQSCLGGGNVSPQPYLIIATEHHAGSSTGPAYVCVPITSHLLEVTRRRVQQAKIALLFDAAFHRAEYVDAGDLGARWLEAGALSRHPAAVAVLKDSPVVVVETDPLCGAPGYEVETTSLLVNSTDVWWEATDGETQIVSAQVTCQQLAAFLADEVVTLSLRDPEVLSCGSR